MLYSINSFHCFHKSVIILKCWFISKIPAEMRPFQKLFRSKAEIACSIISEIISPAHLNYMAVFVFVDHFDASLNIILTIANPRAIIKKNPPSGSE